MPTPNAEGTRAKVAEALQRQPPMTWRQIKREFKVGDQFISDVKRKLGLPMEGKKRPPAPPPAAPPEAPPTGGNGMDEFIPPDEPKAPKPVAAGGAPKAPPKSASKGASGGARSDPPADEDERPTYACDAEAGGCGTEWKLRPGESPATECPGCGVSLS